MHYVKFLRPPTVDYTDRQKPKLSIVLTITTDLSDSLLEADEEVRLGFLWREPPPHATVTQRLWLKADQPPIVWKRGMRVLKALVDVPLGEVETKGVRELRLQVEGPDEWPRPWDKKGKKAKKPGDEHVTVELLDSGDFALPTSAPDRDHVYQTQHGLVMPAAIEYDGASGEFADVSLRTLNLGTGDMMVIEEDIGESMARHIWDGGLVTAAHLARLSGLSGAPPALQMAAGGEPAIDAYLPIDTTTTTTTSSSSSSAGGDGSGGRRHSVSILELGCGVGTLGIALSHIVSAAAAAQDPRNRKRKPGQKWHAGQLSEAHVLLTDLPDAEARARANIERRRRLVEFYGGEEENGGDGGRAPRTRTRVEYENLDWDEVASAAADAAAAESAGGRGATRTRQQEKNPYQGGLGPAVRSRFWDHIVLSDCTYNEDSFEALVSTLGALFEHNGRMLEAEGEDEDEEASRTRSREETRVLLSTKPRHGSESGVFPLLRAAGWAVRLLHSVPVAHLGRDEGEEVLIYSLTRTHAAAAAAAASRKRDLVEVVLVDEDDEVHETDNDEGNGQGRSRGKGAENKKKNKKKKTSAAETKLATMGMTEEEEEMTKKGRGPRVVIGRAD